jgi:hypothetical protein
MVKKLWCDTGVEEFGLMVDAEMHNFEKKINVLIS